MFWSCFHKGEIAMVWLIFVGWETRQMWIHWGFQGRPSTCSGPGWEFVHCARRLVTPQSPLWSCIIREESFFDSL